jgi:hypothetical protein
MNSETILSLIRHVTVTAGALLVAKGFADTEMIEGIAGAIAAIVGFFLFRRKAKTTVESKPA